MIYLLHGNNFRKSREKLHSLVGSLLTKDPQSSSFHLDSEDFKEEALDELISGQTLFAGKYIVVLDKLFSNKDIEKVVMKKLKEISKSPNIFIFIEEELSKTVLARFKKWAEKIQEFSRALKKEEGFNVFSITDALGKCDRKGLWVLYQKARGAGVSPEEIQGVLFWQAKNLLMVKRSQNPNNLGLNPYVLRKTLSFVSNFGDKELVEMSEHLVDISHRVRRGEGEMDILLEKFLLSV